MADFSELKAAIRQDIKDNTEQEITGDVLQGDLLRMVDDINAAKADTAVVEDLSRQVADDAEMIASFASIIGIDVSLLYFTDQRPFAVGDFCIHYEDGKWKPYQFVRFHRAGAWNADDVIYSDIYGIFRALYGTDTELLTIHAEDAEGNGIEGVSIAITFDDGGASISLTTNAQGEAQTVIAKNRVYTIIPSQIVGDLPVVPVKRVANSDKYDQYFIYTTQALGYTNLTVKAYYGNTLPPDLTPFVGKYVQMQFANGSHIDAAFDANGDALFENIPRGTTATLIFPRVSGYARPADMVFYASEATMAVAASYGSLAAAGIYLLRNDGAKIAPELWEDAPEDCAGVWIATQELLDAECAFAVRLADLTAEQSRKKWCSANVLLPNVRGWNSATPYYDGAEATDYMINDAFNAGVSIPAADYCKSETITLGGNVTTGFLGTRDQIQVLFDCTENVQLALNKVGSVANYIDRNIWSSSQDSHVGAWSWNKTEWNGSSYGRGTEKNCIPFFAIP